jgi:hypothetical protein
MMQLPRAPMRRGPEDSKDGTALRCGESANTTRRGEPGGGFALFFSPKTPVPMLIRLEDNTLIEDLSVHYRRSGFLVEHLGGGLIDVARADAPTPEQERHEVLLHLRVWEAVTPDGRAELLD